MPLTVICPQCKALCSLQESAVDKSVACSRCHTVFTARSPASPIPVLKHFGAPALSRGMRLSISLLVLFGFLGTLTIVGFSAVFFKLQYDRTLSQDDQKRFQGRRGHGWGQFGNGVLTLPDAEAGETETKTIPPDLDLANATPTFAWPGADQKTIDLAVHPSVGDSWLALRSWLEVSSLTSAGVRQDLAIRTIAQFVETVQAVDPAGERARIRLRYRGYRGFLSPPRSGSRPPAGNPAPVIESLRKETLSSHSRTERADEDVAGTRDDALPFQSFLIRDERGLVAGQQMDLKEVPAEERNHVQAVHRYQQLALELVSFPLISMQGVPPDHSWVYRREVLLPVDAKRSVPAILETALTFKGVKRVNGGDVAVLHWTGQILDPRRSADDRPGELKGWAYAEPGTGKVLETHLALTFDLSPTDQDPTDQGNLRHAAGSLTLVLKRIPPLK